MDAHRIAIEPDPFARSNVSAGFRVGGLAFLSSVGPLDADGRLVGGGDFDAQAEQAFRNLEALLAAAGSGLDRVIKVKSPYLTFRVTVRPATPARSIRAQGLKQAQIIRAEADAEAASTYAEAFGKDPDFYDFYRAMQSYETTFVTNSGQDDGRSSIVLSPSNDYLREFRGQR